ncbi:MAG: aquaporin [Candidatus Acidiferrales bacterium]
MKKYTAELVGTFVLVFGGVGSAVLAGGKIGYLGIAFAFGLSLLAMVYTIGPISGCHINPAVNFGMLVSKKIGAKDPAAYMIAQIIGAVIASALILYVASNALTLIHLVGIPITNTSVNPARSIGPAIFVGGWALQQLWLFIVAPLVGATLAAVVYGAMRIPGETITPREAERALQSEQAERARGAAVLT